ncbi:MAG: hypothetical protein AAF648_00340 [Pseudomonadota bacterium]
MEHSTHSLNRRRFLQVSAQIGVTAGLIASSGAALALAPELLSVVDPVTALGMRREYAHSSTGQRPIAWHWHGGSLERQSDGWLLRGDGLPSTELSGSDFADGHAWWLLRTRCPAEVCAELEYDALSQG